MSFPTKILSFDIGGTAVKAALLTPSGELIGDKVRLLTPPLRSAPPLIKLMAQIATKLPGFDAISIGFPGVVKKGIIISSPTLSERLEGAPLQKLLDKQFKVPIRVINDATMQAMPVIKGKDIEVVLTLGTGFGFAWFIDGKAAGHLEMSTHPLLKNKTYNQVLGDRALKKKGKAKWSQDVEYGISVISKLTNYDTLYIGGGNARNLANRLPKNVHIISNDNGIVGGAWLWREEG